MAAFMSTVDTHINVAASFFVNDVWRRFIRPDASPRHHVLVGRLASVGVMAMSGFLAWQAESIGDLFMFFLAFLGGVGPVYLARWVWWRVRAAHEIAAMLASALSTLALTFVWDTDWTPGPLAPGGVLSAEGRLCLVVGFSLIAVLVVTPFVGRPDPATLLTFYRRVRPKGLWGPVAALAPEVERPRELLFMVTGVIGGLACVWGAMIATGLWLLDRGGEAAVALAVAGVGTAAMAWALRRLSGRGAAAR
jgi:SSS family solute:Na+ symporter